jgi:hypothetical protein
MDHEKIESSEASSRSSAQLASPEATTGIRVLGRYMIQIYCNLEPRSSILTCQQEITQLSLSPVETIDEHNGAAFSLVTDVCEFKRVAVRRRHSLQQKDEEASCASTLAATADVFEPLNKMPKPDSPGEASCMREVVLSSSPKSSLNDNVVAKAHSRSASFDHLPDELILHIFHYLVEGDLAQCSSVSRRFKLFSNDPDVWYDLDMKSILYVIMNYL